MALLNLVWPQWRNKPEWREHEWRWMQWGVGAMWSYVMRWCRVSKWSTNHWQQCGHIEINDNRIQLSKTDKTQQEETRKGKTKPQAAFRVGPRESCFEVVCFRYWQRGEGVFCRDGGVDKLAKTFCCALRLYLLLMAPKHKTITKHNSPKHPLSSKVQAGELDQFCSLNCPTPHQF